MVIKALIAARSGSERVLDKNTRPFADSSLLEIKIRQLMRIKDLDGVVVNSNDDYALTLAKRLGCEIVRRDDYFASNDVSMSEVCVNIAENFDAEVMIYANCTNPMILDKTISDSINRYYELNSEFDSLNTATPIKEFLFKDGVPINYTLDMQPRSQDLPEIYALNFAVNIISKKTILKTKNIVGEKPYIFATTRVEGIDIDELLKEYEK